jgi:hypothetical protein
MAGASAAASIGGGIMAMKAGSDTASLSKRNAIKQIEQTKALAKYEREQSKIFAGWQAKQLKQAGREAQGAAAVNMRERFRDAELLQSTVTARAAASGGGVSNPTVLTIMQDIEARGAELAGYENLKGLREARGYERQAAATIFQNKIDRRINKLTQKANIANIRMGASATASAAKAQGMASMISGLGNAASAVSSGYSQYRSYG